jgi:hypothetical protein
MEHAETANVRNLYFSARLALGDQVDQALALNAAELEMSFLFDTIPSLPVEPDQARSKNQCWLPNATKQLK